MINLNTPFLFYVIALITDIFIAFLAWERRRFPGGLMLFFMMLAAAEWTLFAGLEIYESSLHLKILYSQLSFIGALACPIFFLLFTLSVTGDLDHLNPLMIALLFVVPIITLILIFTNEEHHLVWNNLSSFSGTWGTIQYKFGPVYWIGSVAYTDFCLIVGAIALSKSIIRKKFSDRFQVNLLLIATMVPWVGSLIYVTKIIPLTVIDISPFAFSITGIVIAISIFRLRFMDIKPIARDILFDEMVDSLIVLDPKDRIIDINPAGVKMVGSVYKNCIGKPAMELLGRNYGVLLEQSRKSSHQTEIIWDEAGEKALEVTVVPINGKNGKFNGYLLVNKDVTEQRMIDNILEETNQILRQQLNEIQSLQMKLREEAIHDPLTELFNRRFLDDMLGLQIGQAKRNDSPISIIMLDLDNFKLFNDTCGHFAGDAVLKNLSQLLKSKTRYGDFACRYGGEEFLVVMPGATITAAMKRAEELRKEFENTPVIYEGKSLCSTFSAGVAAYPNHALTPEGLIKAADKSLYHAKNSGKNRVASPDTPAPVIPLLTANT